jgi:hypothetical protein
MNDAEDSANAISEIIVASCAPTGRVRPGFGSQFVPWCAARTASGIPRDKSSAENLANPAVESMRLRKSMDAFVSEFFAQSVLRRLGIRTVPQKICTASEARKLPADFVVKTASSVPMARHLSWNPGEVPTGWCLASRLVPHAATLDYISRKLIVGHDARTQFVRQCAGWYAMKDKAIDETIARALEKTCVPADIFFTEFKPTQLEIEAIKSAMAIDGSQYIAISAARVFLGCSAPHFSNVLATVRGELISLDHARACFEDGEDLRNLFGFVNRNSEVFKILGQVSALTEDDIRECVSEIPKHPAVGSTNGLADYYVQRLQLWKQLHAKELPNLTSMTVGPKSTYSTAIAAVGGRQILEEAAAFARAWK